jgi:hypothetical protein
LQGIRAEARTYLRSKNNNKLKRRSRSLRDDSQKGKGNSTATAPGVCEAGGVF